MKLSDFILINEDEKKNILLNQGTLVAKRTNYECFIFLFQLDTFYVEIYCNLETKKVQEYRAFEGTKPLTPYLESIPIEDLLT